MRPKQQRAANGHAFLQKQTKVMNS